MLRSVFGANEHTELGLTKKPTLASGHAHCLLMRPEGLPASKFCYLCCLLSLPYSVYLRLVSFFSLLITMILNLPLVREIDWALSEG